MQIIDTQSGQKSYCWCVACSGLLLLLMLPTQTQHKAWSEEVVVKEWEQSVEAACEKAGLEVDTVFRKDSIEMSLKMRQVKLHNIIIYVILW